jgi:signal transduction histidine kinase
MVFFMVTFIRDRLKNEEQQAARLKELDSAKTQFYTNISHEFRTPLTIILGMTEQIAAHPERYFGEGLDMIRHNSRRILSLVNQMLELSKLDAGSMPLHLRQCDVLPLFRNPTKSIIEIAFDTGFHDPDYFGRAFRKSFGLTPTEYRVREGG